MTEGHVHRPAAGDLRGQSGAGLDTEVEFQVWLHSSRSKDRAIPWSWFPYSWMEIWGNLRFFNSKFVYVRSRSRRSPFWLLVVGCREDDRHTRPLRLDPAAAVRPSIWATTMTSAWWVTSIANHKHLFEFRTSCVWWIAYLDSYTDVNLTFVQTA